MTTVQRFDLARAANGVLCVVGAASAGVLLAHLLQLEVWWTERHLAGYYCCVTEGALPAPGTLARAVSDFFTHWPGRHLPALFLAMMVGTLGVRALVRAGTRAWLVPPGITLLLGLAMVGIFASSTIGWALSSALHGPRTGPFTALTYTWPGIVLHATVWLVLAIALWRLPRWYLRPR